MVLCLQYCFEKRRAISFSATDGWIAALVCYVLVRNIAKGDVDPLQFYSILLGWMLYVVGRTSLPKERTVLFYTLVAAGVIQSVIGLLQFSGIAYSNHLAFRLTGSFQNPGMLGGYLACSMAVAIGMLALLPRQRQIGRIALYTSLVLMGIVCLLSDSRAAWLAVIVVTAAMAVHRIRTKYYYIKLIGIGLASVLLLTGLYLYKQKSADSRILIWKVCTSMLLDKPLFGHGADAVQRNYAPYLAKHLRQSTSREEQELAADNTYAFNEPLGIGCEYGVMGILLVMGLFLSMTKESKRNKHYSRQLALYLILAFGVFSLFSYPLDCMPLAMILPLAVGMAASGKSYFTFRYGKPALLLVFTCVTLSFLPEWKRNNRLGTMLFAFRHEWLFEEELQKAYSRFKNQTHWVLQYATTLFRQERYEAALPIFIQASKLCPTNRIYCDLGYCYQQTGAYQTAEHYYTLASATFPTYMTPKYRLFKLYRLQKRETEAEQIAVEIRQMKAKVENNATRNMRKEVLLYLQTGS